jgi:hypothetical protein
LISLSLFPENPKGFPAGPNKKKEKIGTVFCPKGGLAVISLEELPKIPRGNFS